MRFDLSVKMTNAAFEGDEAGELARILDHLAARLRGGEYVRLEAGDYHNVHDVNGATVGAWEVSDPTCPECDAPLDYEGATCPDARLSAHS